jgi:hypothetical protein
VSVNVALSEGLACVPSDATGTAREVVEGPWREVIVTVPLKRRRSSSASSRGRNNRGFLQRDDVDNDRFPKRCQAGNMMELLSLGENGTMHIFPVFQQN